MSYFTYEELRCKGSGKAYPAEFIQMGRGPILMSSANELREAHGYAITTISGYRDPAYNAELREASIQRQMAAGFNREEAEKRSGVAKDSKHMYGMALDLRSTFCGAQGLFDLAMSMIKRGGLKHVGALRCYVNENWVHMDIRPRKPDGSIVTWE